MTDYIIPASPTRSNRFSTTPTLRDAAVKWVDDTVSLPEPFWLVRIDDSGRARGPFASLDAARVFGARHGLFGAEIYEIRTFASDVISRERYFVATRVERIVSPDALPME